MRFLSLFSGIEAASAAWAPLGWTCVAVSEIDKFANEVLRCRHPNVRNLGDVTKITETDIASLGDIDVVIFGSPCQDLSIAGKRKGLDGARSGLFFDAMRILAWSRFWCGTRFAVWENVPGAFSSNKGCDFAAVVDALSGLDGTPVPPRVGVRKAVLRAPNQWSNGLCSTRSISEWRSGAGVCSLSQILETGPVANRYYLSPKACAGLLRRQERRPCLFVSLHEGQALSMTEKLILLKQAAESDA